MKAEPLVTRALRDAIEYCDLMGEPDQDTPRALRGMWRSRGYQYRDLLAKLEPAKSVPKRGRRGA